MCPLILILVTKWRLVIGSRSLFFTRYPLNRRLFMPRVVLDAWGITEMPYSSGKSNYDFSIP